MHIGIAQYCLFCETGLSLARFPESLREKVCEPCWSALKVSTVRIESSPNAA